LPDPLHKGWGEFQRLLPGVFISIMIAMSASFVAGAYGVPHMLLALLFGMVVHFLARTTTGAPGINFASKTVLRFGVALLGLRIGLSDVMDLGTTGVLIVVGAVAATISFGVLLAPVLGLGRDQGALSGGATAICGASAALAISSVLPPSKQRERDTLFTVIAVTTLSTIAMVLYPALTAVLGFDDVSAGFLVGASIHDVAQVVGAGYMISPEAGDMATITKLLRVALLVPACFVLSIAFSHGRQSGSYKTVPLPWFLVVFIVLAVLNSTGVIPVALAQGLKSLSSWCLVTAVAAIGVKSSLGEIRAVGLPAAVLVVCETLFILGVVLVAMLVF
jgi:uncharacterized integral membrane protein (TIGR00698 family)